MLARSPTHVIHQLRTSPHATSLKCEHRTYKSTSLVSPHESNRIWTSLLISSRVHHHPWTYPLMAQHLLIQVSHHCLKATHTSHRLHHYRLTRPKRCQAKPAHTAWWNLLAARRQAPDRPTVSGSVAWRNTLHRQAPRGAESSLRSYRLASIPIVVRRHTRSTPMLVLALEIDHNF